MVITGFDRAQSGVAVQRGAAHRAPSSLQPPHDAGCGWEGTRVARVVMSNAEGRWLLSATGVSNLDHSIEKANTWLAEVAGEFGTDDRRFAYRVTRAWMHALRDRLPISVAAHLAAQLPELLRGVFYDGWNPSHVPDKFNDVEYVRRFARDANIHNTEVKQAAGRVTKVMRQHVSAGAIDEAMDALPTDIRKIAA